MMGLKQIRILTDIDSDNPVMAVESITYLIMAGVNKRLLLLRENLSA